MLLAAVARDATSHANNATPIHRSVTFLASRSHWSVCLSVYLSMCCIPSYVEVERGGRRREGKERAGPGRARVTLVDPAHFGKVPEMRKQFSRLPNTTRADTAATCGILDILLHSHGYHRISTSFVGFESLCPAPYRLRHRDHSTYHIQTYLPAIGTTMGDRDLPGYPWPLPDFSVPRPRINGEKLKLPGLVGRYASFTCEVVSLVRIPLCFLDDASETPRYCSMNASAS